MTVVEWDCAALPKAAMTLIARFPVQTEGAYIAAMAIGPMGFTDTPPTVALQFLSQQIIAVHSESVSWNGWRQRAYFLNSDTDSHTTPSSVHFLIPTGQMGSTLIWDDLMLFGVSDVVGTLREQPARNAGHDE